MSVERSQRIRQLAFAYADGPLTEDEVRELESLLGEGPEAVEEYVACMKLHSRLGRVLGGLGSSGELPCLPVDAFRADPAPVSASAVEPRTDSRWGRRALLSALLAVAASAALAWIGLPLAEGPAPFVARVVDKVDCDWETERWGTGAARDLDEGRVLKLNRGLMRIEFGDGAEVTLEGPVQFEVVSASRGFLHSGKLTARVPKRARGFTVGTPSCESIDLGTEFGLKVLEDGTAETHVFDGEVVLRQSASDEAAAPDDLHLTTSMAARVDGESLSLTEQEARPASFTRILSDAPDTAAPPATPSVPKGRGLALWLEAGRRVQTDERGRVSSWGDLLYGDNEQREDAWQVRPIRRPRLVDNGIGGRPSVRFNGQSHLITAPLATGDDVTVFIVFRCHEHEISKNKAAMLINFNGPPAIVVSRSWEDDLMGRMYSGYSDGVASHGSWLKAPVLEEGAPVVAAYVYSTSENRSALYANGRLCASGEATKPAAIVSPKYIGRNHMPKGYFVGDMSELLIFNSALSAADCVSVSALLSEKYGVEPDATLAGGA